MITYFTVAVDDFVAKPDRLLAVVASLQCMLVLRVVFNGVVKIV